MEDLSNELVSPEEFHKVNMRVGQIIKAEPFPKARRPSYRLTIDFGPYGIKTSSSQLTERYTLEDLTDRKVIGVINLPTRQVANFFSEVLVLGIPVDGTDDVILVQPEADAPLGSRAL
ncbi:tRNA-binding protein [Salininema proteolyticum]|uniref:tRNA-binding protein n=1 Tax=Salininema proteolyticum TaxID=1607685 RepID=A0ABV8U147_9ACTN